VRLLIAAIMIGGAVADVAAQKQLVMLARIADASGREADAIPAGDVTVYENLSSIPVARVEAIERVPKLQVLIDNGAGVPSTNLSDLRNAVRRLIETLPPGLDVTLVTTSPAPRFLEKSTTSRTRLLAAADRLVIDEFYGKFTDSLYEAAERADKDPNENAAHTILTIGTTIGDANVLEADMQRTLERIGRRRIPVYVVLLTNPRTNTGGVQQDLGEAAARMAGGAIETINTMNRLITLLPEVGRSLAGSMVGGKLFRITAQRPSLAPMGKISVSVKGMTVVDLALDTARTR
jgi:hypothetical protein